MAWFVYMVRCADGTLYTGVATDIDRRLDEHNAGRGAKYTRGRGPVSLVYREQCRDQSRAVQRELIIKGMTRADKLRLITEPAQ